MQERGVIADAIRHTRVPRAELAPPPCQATSWRRQVQTQVGAPTQQSLSSSGRSELRQWPHSRLTFRGPFEALEHVERGWRANNGVKGKAAAANACESVDLKDAPQQI
ncbi:MAG: hypothetical protein ACI855_003110 [Myxococcota bacterium]